MSKTQPLRARRTNFQTEEEDEIPTFKSSPQYLPKNKDSLYERSRSKTRSKLGIVLLLVALGIIAFGTYRLVRSRASLSGVVTAVGESSVDAWNSIKNSFSDSESRGQDDWDSFEFEDSENVQESTDVPWFLKAKLNNQKRPKTQRAKRRN